MSAEREFHYKVVDVFTRKALEGNALAVFPEATGLDDSTMQRIAREMNLSETVFVVPATSPDCAVRLRIFSPLRELNFAGHPTIGTAFVLFAGRARETVVLSEKVEENVGAVQVRVEGGERPLIWLTTPPIKEGPRFDRDLCAAALGLSAGDLAGPEPQLLDAGNPTLFIAIKDKSAVDKAKLDVIRLAGLKQHYPNAVCVFVFAATPEGAYSRMFAPEFGIAEDPATGSSTGPLAAYMMRHGLAASAPETRFVSEQGTMMGRRSFLHVRIRGEHGADGIEVGGYVTPVATATMRLEAV
jgi:trans-2,3-dihydro-3-hydroxyanthranilate isomerase